MVLRPSLRAVAVRTVTAISLLWLATSGHGQSALSRLGWGAAGQADAHAGPGGDAGNRSRGDRSLLPAGMDRIVLRTGSPDHVRAQIERMEARARADDRLNGRAEAPGAADPATQRRPETKPASATGNDTRPNQIGPGWQAPSSREANR